MPPLEPEYRIIYHDIVKEQIRQCMVALIAAGWQKGALVNMLATAERRLKVDPTACGEPLYNLPLLGMIVYIFCVRPFRLHFGIHQQSRTVFIREVALLTLKLP